MGSIENIRRELWRTCSLPDEPTVWYAGRNGTCRREMPSPRERFLDQLGIVADPDACFIWTGSRHRHHGHATFKYDGTWHIATRIVYEQWVGELGKDDVVLHECGEKLCGNPRHLLAVPRHGMRKEHMRLIPAMMCGGKYSKHTEVRIAALIARAHELGHPHFYRHGHPSRRNKAASTRMYDQLTAEFPDIGRRNMHSILSDKSWRHLPRPWEETFARPKYLDRLAQAD